MTMNTMLDIWANTLKSHSVEKMCELYANDAVLLPTLSSQIRKTSLEIKDYFEHFLAKKPEVTNVYDDASFEQIDSHGSLIVSGNYDFKFGDGSTAKARFTFVFSKLTSKILTHHSSLQPESAVNFIENNNLTLIF